MNCRRVQSQLAALSAQKLSPRGLSCLQDHLANCPECQKEWLLFQQTVQVLSTTSQPVLRHDHSRKMWGTCSEKLHSSIEQQRLKAPRPASALNSGWSFRDWAQEQPRWGWAALGGALVVLGSAFLSPPAGSPAPGPQAESPAPVVTVASRPSQEMSDTVGHHATMTFDPFTDYIGSTLVSYSATSPQR